MPGPLHGTRIIDLSSMISGPLATSLLGDQGADVIKVEAPGTGDLVRQLGASRGGISAIFATSNRNKRSVVLDLKTPGGHDALLRLVDGADVFVQNFRPGTIERMGLGESVLRQRRPGLVYVSISGFGESGPYANKRVYDPVIQALSGLAAIQADRDTRRPRMVRLIVPDKVTALTAAQAVTAALLVRERTGEGQHIRLAMLDATIAFLWPEGMARNTWVGRNVRDARPGLAQDLVFETSDGTITAGAVSDAEWRGMARATGHPEWIDDPRFATASARIANVEARLTLTAEALRTKSTGEWLELFDAEGVPCAPVLSRSEVLDHPQVIENGIVIESVHPQGGPMRQARPAAHFDRTPSEIRRPAPALGEHTDEVLRETGLASAEVDALRASGALG